jgi:hypothetical protein
MKISKRVLRRHHNNRLAKNRKGYWSVHVSRSKVLLGTRVSTQCGLSCWLCGNQRGFGGGVFRSVDTPFPFHYVYIIHGSAV